MFASYSVCTTVAIVTITWLLKFVDEVGSTVFHRSSLRGFTTRRTISKADLPDNFTIFHCRMSTIQPAWPLCTTSVCWHTCCWHFGSCSSHKTIPSLRELVVAQFWTATCYVIYLSIGITQVYIIIARIGYKVKLKCRRTVGIKINGSRFFLTSYNSGSLPIKGETCI